MADRRITEHTELAEQPHANDLIEIVDVSDTTDAASGTNKKIKRANLLGTVLANTTASFTTADETKLDGIESGATADQSAAEILAALLTVDGAGSGLDADLLDGNSSAAFATSGHDHSGTYQPLDADLTDLASKWTAASASGPASLQVAEDTDNGTHKVTLVAPASLASDVTVTLPSVTGTLVTTADNPSDLTPDTLVTETGTSFTLSSTHDGRTVICSNASAVTVTIPTDASDDLRDGYRCVLVSTGAGGVTLSTSGITLLPASPNKTVATGEGIYVEKSTAANTWVVLGGTAA